MDALDDAIYCAICLSRLGVTDQSKELLERSQSKLRRPPTKYFSDGLKKSLIFV
jgi:hypothetical protein